MADKDLPGDAVICGTGYIDGCPVAAFSQDFMIAAGTLGKMHAQKIVQVMKLAVKTGMPVVAFKDSGGARIQEGVDALSGYGEVFYHNVMLSGVVPQIAVICGPCAGGAAYSPALMDFVIMTRKNAYMFITGPEVIKAVTGRATTMGEVGSAEVHASVNGNVHFVAEDDRHAVQIVQKLLSYLPPNNTEDPPHVFKPDIVLDRDESMNELIPDDSSEPMDVRKIIGRIVDGGELLEIHASWAKNLIVGFARIEGIVVGLIANQPTEMAGALDINASDKGARFIRFCNIFNIPIVTLVDVPGFLPGIEQERGGIIRHGAKMLYAYAEATVPKITIVLRKGYGGAKQALCTREMGADQLFVWPGVELAVMGGGGAVNVLYRREIELSSDPAKTRAEKVAEFQERFNGPFEALSKQFAQAALHPADTRKRLIQSLEILRFKKEERPRKKHGVMPV